MAPIFLYKFIEEDNSEAYQKELNRWGSQGYHVCRFYCREGWYVAIMEKTGR